MNSFHDLTTWQKAMDLVHEIYMAVRTFPKSEVYVLSQQMRSAAVSIPSNIAEGQGRWTVAENCQFLRHARGSTLELETQILIAARLQFIDVDTAENLIAGVREVGRLINGLLRSAKRGPGNDRSPEN